MKKFLKAILFLCALSSLAYADEAAPVVAEGTASSMSAEDQKEAMDILDRMREKIEKEEAEKAKLAAEARELGVSPSEVASMDNVEELLSIEKQLDFTSIKSYHTRIKYPLFFLNSQHTQALMDFIHTPEGAYMIKGAQQVFELSPRSFSIEILLALYTEGIIPFNEEIFVKNLYF